MSEQTTELCGAQTPARHGPPWPSVDLIDRRDAGCSRERHSWDSRRVPSSSYVDYALEILAGLGPVRARAMMGGHIVHCGGVAIALVYDDRLSLKTDEETREAFRAAGGEPFTYELRGKVVEMSYCTPPDAALDAPEAMRPWAELALAAALRKRRTSKPASTSARRSARRTSPAVRPRRSRNSRG